MQLELTVRQGPLLVAKTYVVHPGSSIIREWVTFANAGHEPLRLVEPGFLSLATRQGKPSALDFHWMTGGENQPGSWVLKTEKLTAAKPRTFDSYEPFPSAGPSFPGDGINAKITLNGKQVGRPKVGNTLPTPQSRRPSISAWTWRLGTSWPSW